MSDSQQTQTSPVTPESQQPAPPAATTAAGNGLGLTSLIIGILALIGAFIPFINYVSGFLALVGLVFGIVGLTRKGKAKGSSIAGTAISAVAILLSIILAVVYTAGFAAAVDNALPQTGTSSSAEDAPAGDDTAAGDELGTRENPAPIGTVIETTSGGAVEYEIIFGAPTLDATALIAAENQFNAAPEAGMQYAMVPVTFTYQGTETGTPWIDVTVEFVSAAGTTHTTSDALVVGPSPSIMEVNELYPGASGTANIVIAVPTADIETGAWAVSGFWGSDKYFVAAQ